LDIGLIIEIDLKYFYNYKSGNLMTLKSWLHLSVLSCLITSCSQAPKENDNSTETITKTNAVNGDTVAQITSSQEGIDYKSFNAIVTGSDLSLRKDSSMKEGNIFAGLTEGQLEKGEKRMAYDPQEEDPCTMYGYYWYKVTTGKETGWIWGNELLQKGKPYTDNTDGLYQKLKSFLGKEVTFKGKKLYFDIGVDLSIGASNEEGLTGCDRHYFPYFYDESGKIYFIKSDQTLFVGKDFLVQSAGGSGNLMMTMDSEAGTVDLKKIGTTKRFDEEVIVIYSDHSYQNSSANSAIYVGWKEDQMKVVDYVLNKQ
jgi:hypothetical protein